MTIENMSNEELKAALQEDIAAADAAYEGTYSEQEGELEENTQETESEVQDGGQEQEEEVSQPEEKVLPKTKSIQKVLSERNELRKRIAELEAQAGTSKEVDLEYINKVAERVAYDIIEEKDFFGNNPDAVELKDEIKTLAKEHNLDLDKAYKLYLLDNNPDELRVQANKQNAKKLSTPSYSASKLKATPKAAELSSAELAAQLNDLVKK